jgi:flagella basal body P-ring formation protein FlgA
LKAIIRGGDRLVVEQNTAVIEARLEAVALGPARRGATFQARLKIGGKVVRVVALAPGRAELAPEIGVWHGGWR